MSELKEQPQKPARACCHRRELVRAGPYEIRAGGLQHLQSGDLDDVDLLIPLSTDRPMPVMFGKRYHVFAGTLADFGGVPPDWPAFLQEVIAELEAGKRLLVFCVAGHGRTGCFLASLISLLESERETPDPIAAVRQRHCDRAVETRAQAEAIFALRGRTLPAQYEREFPAHR